MPIPICAKTTGSSSIVEALFKARVAANPRENELVLIVPKVLPPREGETRRKELIRRQDLKQEPNQRREQLHQGKALDPMARNTAAALLDTAHQAKELQHRVNYRRKQQKDEDM